MRRRLNTLAALAAVAIVGGILGTASAASAHPGPVKARTFHSCHDLNKVYHHGVGMPGARDAVRHHQHAVKDFTRDARSYDANRRLDADRDGIACER